jgi:hypothetical protein
MDDQTWPDTRPLLDVKPVMLLLASSVTVPMELVGVALEQPPAGTSQTSTLKSPLVAVAVSWMQRERLALPKVMAKVVGPNEVSMVLLFRSLVPKLYGGAQHVSGGT